MIDRNLLDAIDELQLRYARALDEQDMQGWLACFATAPEASYTCTTREAVRANHKLALMLDDCHARLEDRVSMITKVWAGTFQDYQTRHVVQRLDAAKTADGRIRVHSNFMVAFTPEETGQTAMLASGSYDDVVVQTEGGLRFLSKSSICDASVMAHYLVYPL